MIRASSLLVLIAMPQPGIVTLGLRDRSAHHPPLDYQFWIDDLLEKQLYDVPVINMESLHLSISVLLNTFLI